MRIGIDARMCGVEQGGLGRYVEELLKGLAISDRGHTFVVFVREKNKLSIPESRNIERIVVDIPWYGFKEQFFFTKKIKSTNVDLMHFPHWNVPIMYNDPFVVTVHDLLLLRFPSKKATTRSFLTYAFKFACYKKVLAHAIKKSKLIFAPSLFTMQDIETLYPFAKGKITVTYESAEHMRTVRSIEDAETALLNFGISKKYFLYVGVAYPHKNLLFLLSAWKKFCDRNGYDKQLILVGKEDYFYKEIKNKIKKFNDPLYEKTVVCTGLISDSMVKTLYMHAIAFVFPSKYEGFGIPGLEAMECGTPLLASNASCFPEIYGEAALYFNPDNEMRLVEVMERIIEDDDISFVLRKNAKLELQNYSWKKNTEQTLMGYENSSV